MSDVSRDSRGGISDGTPSSLIAGVRKYDPGAWQRLVSLYGPLVYGWARRAGLGGEDSADITQEVFRAVAANTARFQHGGAGHSFRGWLRTITTNKLRDFWRRLGSPAMGGSTAQELLALLPQGDSSDSSPSSRSNLLPRAVELVRAEFEVRSWEAFWLVTIEDRPAGDVARELGISRNAVYVARSRILKRLREVLAEEDPGSEEYLPD